MNKIKFILWVQCIPKGKRKVQNVKRDIHQLSKTSFDLDKENYTKDAVRMANVSIEERKLNGSIKNVTGARLVIREVEETEDAFGTMETYIPTNDVIITIL